MAVSLNGDGTITGLSTLDSVTITGLTSLTTTDLTADTTTLVVDSANNLVGVGTNSPNDITGTGLRQLVVGNNSGNNGVIVNSSSSGDSAYSFAVNNVKLGRVGYDYLNNMTFQTNNAERMRITSSGNLGIGTATPNERFHVIGNGRFYASTLNYGLLRLGGESNNFIIGYDSTHSGTPDSIALKANATNGYIYFQVNGGEKMRIDSSGNVGIGTSSINAAFAPRLEVYGTANNGTEGLLINTFAPTLTLLDRSAGGTTYQIKNDATALSFRYEAGASGSFTERMRITSAGNVGIGTSSPSEILHVYKNSASPTILARFENPGDEAIIELKSKNTDLGIVQFADTEDGNVGAVQYSHGENSMRFKTNDIERMRIASDGRLTVGNTNGQITFPNLGQGTDKINSSYPRYKIRVKLNRDPVYYSGLVLDIYGSGGADFGGHGKVTYYGKLLITISGTSAARVHIIQQEGRSYIDNGSTNLYYDMASITYDTNFLYIDLRFNSNINGTSTTGFAPAWTVVAYNRNGNAIADISTIN